MRNWLNDVQIHDLPNRDMQLVAEQCGIDIALLLIERLGGLCLYIPQKGDSLLMKKYILRNYDGTNAKDLALELGTTERYIYKVMAEKAAPPNQLGLFEKENGNGKKNQISRGNGR